MPALKVERVSKAFGGLLALAEVDLEVAPGERRAVIGPNGAGKSTLFKIIAGELQPTRGRVYLQGRPVSGLPQERVARMGLARTFQKSTAFGELTVWENVALAWKAARGQERDFLNPLVPEEEVRAVLERVALLPRAEEKAGNLSHGEKRQLEIAMALVQKPQVLLLDEPLAGLSGAERERMGRLIRELDRNTTVLLVEHDLDYALAFADRVAVLHYGQIVAEGTPEAIRENPVVQEIYVGKPEEAPRGNLDSSASRPKVLEAVGISAGYGSMQVLHQVSLEVNQGEVVALLGRNGMGKTTLMSTLMGLLPLQKGEVRLEGRPLGPLPPYARAELGLALVPQGRRMFEGLTVEEELRMAAWGRKGTWTMERVLDVFPRLGERLKTPSRALSGGEQQMVAIARALLRNPRIVLMDEPTEGLSPLMVRQVAEVVRALKAEGETVLLAEQNVKMALSVADRVYILEHGEIVWEGQPQEATGAILHRYLGL